MWGSPEITATAITIAALTGVANLFQGKQIHTLVNSKMTKALSDLAEAKKEIQDLKKQRKAKSRG